MTKKHFAMIAKVISDFLDNGENDQLDGIAGVDILARKLADIFENVNPRFDRSRFLEACGLYEI